MSAVGPVKAALAAFGTASTSAGAPSGRLAGIGPPVAAARVR